MQEIWPLHEIKDWAKVDSIAASMDAEGWTSYPVLVVDCGEGVGQALTGTHRLAAAHRCGIDPDIYTIGPATDSPLWADLLDACRDEDRLAALESMHAAGLVDYAAVEIMRQEVDKAYIKQDGAN